MGSTGVTLEVRPYEEDVFHPRKRFKTSELPLNANQRSTIDGLLHTIKKKGHWDTLRKKVWSEFENSDQADLRTLQDAKSSFKDRLIELADAEIDRDPSLLSRDRGKAATLMQGAVDRSDIYKSVELSLDRLISEHLNHVLAAGREIRKAEVGEEAAADEERRGNIPDEDYAKDAANRREARERQRKQDATRRLREKEKERLRAEAMKKEAELERLRKADDRRRERKAREEQLQQERKKRAEEDAEWRKRDEQLRQEGAGRDDSSQRPKEESRSRQRSIERVEAAAKELSRSPHPSKEDDASTPSNAKPEIDEKAIEAAALEELLRESRELAAKSSSKPQRNNLNERLEKKQALTATTSTGMTLGKQNPANTIIAKTHMIGMTVVDLVMATTINTTIKHHMTVARLAMDTGNRTVTESERDMRTTEGNTIERAETVVVIVHAPLIGHLITDIASTTRNMSEVTIGPRVLWTLIATCPVAVRRKMKGTSTGIVIRRTIQGKSDTDTEKQIRETTGIESGSGIDMTEILDGTEKGMMIRTGTEIAETGIEITTGTTTETRRGGMMTGTAIGTRKGGTADMSVIEEKATWKLIAMFLAAGKSLREREEGTEVGRQRRAGRRYQFMRFSYYMTTTTSN
ncbi:MAG: hypothetical protein LQ338_000577 [Usnochroma carphineum]|nr:MAG: hypothetical protein LQ338_000577 [Usnochroma carphineum]